MKRYLIFEIGTDESGEHCDGCNELTKMANGLSPRYCGRFKDYLVMDGDVALRNYFCIKNELRVNAEKK